jgi:hypothetical protein
MYPNIDEFTEHGQIVIGYLELVGGRIRQNDKRLRPNSSASYTARDSLVIGKD